MNARMSTGGLRFLLSLPLAPCASRAAGRGALLLAAVGVVALEATREGIVPLRPAIPVAEAAEDPVMAKVGPMILRLSDLRAQAGPARGAAPPDALIREGYLADATGQLALAAAAEAEGLDRALEIRAKLALARRRVLAEAYLDLALREAVTEEAVRAAYEAELGALREEAEVSLRHILVSSREEAEALADRIRSGARFSELAQRQSLDMDTRSAGGSFGPIALSRLPDALAAAAADLSVGELSAPVRSEAGWHLLRVDSRRDLRPPSFAARKDAIAASLREAALIDAVTQAETRFGVRLQGDIGSEDPRIAQR